ncbi:helix-turn-helix domain-containing protein [Nocardia sp. NPDC051911]|uniref:helix-turn-helix transcriptional regulator n=1 Tax=Nocardia sp. NPDC051911 TaxID=3154648 RepID=UPI0034198DF1
MPDHEPTTPAASAAHPHRRNDWLTTAELAQEYKLNIGTLRYWRHIGYGPASFALGRKIFYRRTDVQAWIAEQEHQTRRGGTTTGD